MQANPELREHRTTQICYDKIHDYLFFKYHDNTSNRRLHMSFGFKTFDGSFAALLHIAQLVALRCDSGADKQELHEYRNRLLASGLDDEDKALPMDLNHHVAESAADMLWKTTGGAGRPIKDALQGMQGKKAGAKVPRQEPRAGQLQISDVRPSKEAKHFANGARPQSNGVTPESVSKGRPRKRANPEDDGPPEAPQKVQRSLVEEEFEEPIPCAADEALGLHPTHTLTHKRGAIVCTSCGKWANCTRLQKLQGPCDPDAISSSAIRVIYRWLRGSGGGLPDPRCDWCQPAHSPLPEGFYPVSS